jgi:penicillin-binding protein 1A
VTLSVMPEHLIDAVLTMEDRRFYEHDGIDPRGILRALLADLEARDIQQGGSTITQQLAKNLFLTPERTLARKLQEVLLALWLERRLTKDEILARYLNSVYLGAGAHGVEAASRRYFNKPVSELRLAESAMLAGLIQAPSLHAPTRSIELARERAEVVLNAMEQAGRITAEMARKARQHPARLAIPPSYHLGYGYAADWLAAQDFSVMTTLDLSLQRLAEATVAEWLEQEGAAKGADQAALVAMRQDGAVVAMVGGRNYLESQFNRATQAKRQPGSLFKLFVYLAALDKGMSPESPIVDEPIRIGEWQPENYGGRYFGLTNLRTAFSKSFNSAAVRLQEMVGREHVIAWARKLGIKSPLDPNPSLALGTSEVTLLEMTAAYAALAAGRENFEPYGIQALRGGDGSILLPQRSVGDKAAWPRSPMLDLLGEVVLSGTGRAARLSVPAYGKTGTTQDHRDAWFIGFAGDLVVGVWVGNDDSSPMDKVSGGNLPAAIWRSFMEAAIDVPAARPVAAQWSQGDEEEPQLVDEEPVTVTIRRGGREEQIEVSPAPPEPIAGAEEGEMAFGAGIEVVGVPSVIDTGTLVIAGQLVKLQGVHGAEGMDARAMSEFIGGREVACQRRARAYRCRLDSWDLSELVLFNGGGVATADAPPDLLSAERSARQRGAGLWSRR